MSVIEKHRNAETYMNPDRKQNINMSPFPIVEERGADTIQLQTNLICALNRQAPVYQSTVAQCKYKFH